MSESNKCPHLKYEEGEYSCKIKIEKDLSTNRDSLCMDCYIYKLKQENAKLRIQIEDAYETIEDLIIQFCDDFNDYKEKRKHRHHFMSSEEHAWAYIDTYHHDRYIRDYENLPHNSIESYRSINKE